MKRCARFLLLFAGLVLTLPNLPLRAGVEMVKPAAGKALICFYREVAFEGNWFRYRLADGDTSIGSLPAESFLFYSADPGEHSFQAGLLRHGAVKLHVESGRIYYVRCSPAAEVAYARPVLEPVPVVEGAAVVATLRPGVPAR